MNHFPSKIRSLRGDKTLVEFSKKVGINLKTYQHYEAGTRKPNVNAILQIAVACGVSSDYLLGLSDDSGALPAGERERLEARVAELEAKLHDAEVSIRTLRETILEGNAAPSYSPSSSSHRSSTKHQPA